MNNYYTKTAASVKTFLEQVKNKSAANNREALYKAIRKTPNATKNDLIAHTGLSHQTLTAQLSFLMDFGIVEVSGSTQYIGSTGTVYESFFTIQTNETKITANQKNRRKLKFKRLQKQLKQFSDIVPANILESIKAI